MSRSTEDDDHYDVIVIGAGPSGISAAARLVEEVNLSAPRPLY
jgi:cation diffusion facilitator CzcD-associated flavoprotein CzcO